MYFEYDEAKSAANAAKHGMDFAQAQALWDDDRRVELDAISSTEPRYAVIATHEGKHWAAFYTIRGEKIRIISVRRARKQERFYYERANQNIH